MTKKLDISAETLAECARTASKKAIRAAQENHVNYTVQEGRSIVEHKSDGTKQTIGHLDKAYARPSVKRYRIA